ncbi:dual specificity protein phosphatase family protein [Novipirellula sp. SH528]|uniref:dual specificity protein phosphatase family protein n=1 Tax=Novipirellula sp. SH528 TaxID=3454466 RepID=UPI003FA1460C
MPSESERPQDADAHEDGPGRDREKGPEVCETSQSPEVVNPTAADPELLTPDVIPVARVAASARQRLYARSVFYPTLAWNFTLGRILRVRRWWDYIDPSVIVGAYPFARDVAGLSVEGVRGVVNTCEEYPGPLKAYEAFGIEQFHMPTTDFTHPLFEDVCNAVEFVQRHVEDQGKVYIHCKAGRARSATVAICWLIKHQGLSITEAQAVLLAARPHINPRLGQRPVVQEFAERWGTK